MFTMSSFNKLNPQISESSTRISKYICPLELIYAYVE